MKSSVVRPLTGLGLIVAIGLIIALAVSLFRGDWADTVPVTVISDRAGLVMNPDAKVKMRGVQVGQVDKIERRPDGTAALHLAMDRSALHLIPNNVNVDITSTTVFGAKFVQMNAPQDPSSETLRPGQVIQSKHVTVEINTVFQQLVQVLDKIDPAKLNQTLGAIATAFNGRGEKFGQTLVDFNALLAKIEPSLPNLAHDIEAAVPTFTAYGDAAPDLMSTIQSTTQISNSIVDQQQNLDEFLISAIGLADLGNEVIGGNRQGITDVAHVLVPTAELLNTYRASLRCGIGGLVPFAKSPPQYSGIIVNAGLTLGVERYRYPRDLPKVAAKSGGRDYCDELHLPELEPEFVPPMLIGDVGSNPQQYGNAGILLNSEGLKNWLFGPLDGPPRNTAQIGMPG
ncbi:MULTISPECIES: MCE family protein [unclassified Mycobacterium]|uniref:MCE family protein n=1 Tax=unclassified Mycobacterium TaxID=2642494 RepID=UPI00073FC69C|nr:MULTISPECIES: MCE family protein [unclassified Mycobacterium]KUH80185.1 MCE-family protein [Mycobacterium sp. GA-0227b]KUH81737.1 MCE-family protein [Mycobacterium sp. GA-1999]KUH94017.1 MCE-family protein [Mycobacterium sp. IS-1556]